MSVVAASLVGAISLAIAAGYLSARRFITRLSPPGSVLDDVLKLAATMGFVAGLILVAISVAGLAELPSGWIQIVSLVCLPLLFATIWRWFGPSEARHELADDELLLTKDCMVI